MGQQQDAHAPFLPRRARATKRGGLFVACLTLACLALPARAHEPQAPGGYVCHNARALDGDSLRCGEGVELRLAGIDAPEYDQPFGAEAHARLRTLAGGARLRCALVERDRYKRFVAICERLGRDLAETLTREGLAWDLRNRKPDYSDHHRLAQRQRRGLWSRPNPCRPSQWRHKRC